VRGRYISPTMSDAADHTEAMLSVREVGVFFGGAKNPLSRATVWSWVQRGKLPPPVKINTKTSRWRLSDCKRVRDAIFAAHDAANQETSA
jgi:predicted DNA-binding transcriptional regulator AlpA